METVAASTLFSTSVELSSFTPLSLALNLKESDPAKLELGVKVTLVVPETTTKLVPLLIV